MVEDRRQNNGNRTRLEEMVSDIHTKVERMDAFVFGPEGNTEDGFITRTNDSLKDHHKRIETVEHFRWYLLGLGAAAILAKDFVVHRLLKLP